jgi:hypothetical protein
MPKPNGITISHSEGSPALFAIGTFKQESADTPAYLFGIISDEEEKKCFIALVPDRLLLAGTPEKRF